MTNHHDSRPYWELHVTIIAPPEDSGAIKQMVTSLGWIYSRIDGDPVMGDGIKHYATRHTNIRVPYDAVENQVLAAVEDLRDLGCNVVREKVETVNFDRRYT